MSKLSDEQKRRLEAILAHLRAIQKEIDNEVLAIQNLIKKK